MEVIEKLPRWALVFGFIGFMTIGGFMLKGAWADLDQTKALTQKHDLLIPQLVEDVATIKAGNETFRREYREDQKDLDKKLNELLRAVKQ